MAALTDWLARAEGYERAGYPDSAAEAATLAIAAELRTLNLLLASQILHDAGAGEKAACRLGLDTGRDSAEDGEG